MIVVVRFQPSRRTRNPGKTRLGLRLSVTVPDRVNDGASTLMTTESDASRISPTTMVVPVPTAITRPADVTSATVEFRVSQVTWAPGITRPSWSLTSAASRAVSPRVVNVTVSGATATVVGRGGSTGVGSVPPSPHALAQMAATREAAARLRVRRPRALPVFRANVHVLLNGWIS